MTLVVFRDGIMAADTSLWSGTIMVGETEKIRRTMTGHLVGCAGHCSLTQPFLAWAMDGFPAGVDLPEGESEEDFEAIVVAPDGAITFYDYKIHAETHDLPWATTGNGTAYANGLLAAGWSAKRIVEHAIKHVAYVGGRVTTVTLGPVEEALPDEVVAMESWREERGL